MSSVLVVVYKDCIGVDTKLFSEERDKHEADYFF